MWMALGQCGSVWMALEQCGWHPHDATGVRLACNWRAPGWRASGATLACAWLGVRLAPHCPTRRLREGRAPRASLRMPPEEFYRSYLSEGVERSCRTCESPDGVEGVEGLDVVWVCIEATPVTIWTDGHLVDGRES